MMGGDRLESSFYGLARPSAADDDSSCPRLSRASTSCFVNAAKTWMAGTKPGYDGQSETAQNHNQMPYQRSCASSLLVGDGWGEGGGIGSPRRVRAWQPCRQHWHRGGTSPRRTCYPIACTMPGRSGWRAICGRPTTFGAMT